MSIDRVRAAFAQLDYTVAGVRELLGPVAGAALARDEIVPALRLTSSPGLGALVRLFWLQVPVPSRELPAGLDLDLAALGLVSVEADSVRPLLRVVPLEPADGYAVSDLKVRPGDGRLSSDHVVGAGGASSSLAQLVVHSPVENALDIGTGSGVQAVHLAQRARQVVATDVNPRALALARLSLALSGASAELLEGSLYEPVPGRRFDLIVANPPFVIAPPEGRLTYRESGLDGDDVCRALVRQAPAHLTEGGWCQLLANWLDGPAEPWASRVSRWLEGTGCDAWVVQRDVQDPAEYAELWLRDSCEVGTPEYRARYDAWLDYFEQRKVTGIGFGWITMRSTARPDPVIRVEDLRGPVDQPVGAYVEDVVYGVAHTRLGDLDRVILKTADGLVQEQIGPPGESDPSRIVLRQPDRLRRAAGVGTVEAALAGVCDGTLPLGPLLDAISDLTSLPHDDVRAHAAAVLPELIADGFFTIVSAA